MDSPHTCLGCGREGKRLCLLCRQRFLLWIEVVILMAMGAIFVGRL